MDTCTCFTEENKEHTDDCELIGPDFEADLYNRMQKCWAGVTTTRLHGSGFEVEDRSEMLADVLARAHYFDGVIAHQLKDDVFYDRIETGSLGKQVMQELLYLHKKSDPVIIEYGSRRHDYTYTRNDRKMQNRYFGVMRSNTKKLHVMDDDFDVFTMIQRAFFDASGACELNELAVDCTYKGRDVLTLVSGQYIGIFQCCKNCLRWFSAGEAPARAVVRPLLHTKVPDFENATPEALEVDGSF